MTGSGESASPGLGFLKMHGLGNDFVIIDAREGADPVTPALARALGDRHRGVGFDQLAVVLPDPDMDARIDFWNSDGSMSGACGNATRCIAHLLMAETGATHVALRTGNGRLEAERLADGRVRVDMGPAHLDWQAIPLAEEADTVTLPIAGAPGAVGMGNPHCVFFVDDLDAIDWQARGREMERHPLYPERTNVQFVQIIDRASVRARVWERGVGPTLASGSSACAIVVAGVRKGLLEREVAVHLEGGRLDLEWRGDGHVLMSGPVSHVFEGRLSPAFLAEMRADQAHRGAAE